ncbi:MAG: TIGR04222 domain-containing membrane protein [Blastocatellia bacterium]
MNLFDLRGPEFLFLYFLLSIVVTLAVWLHRRAAESGPAPKLDLSDPYLIAYLRGGENEALRLGVVSLVDRGLLNASDTTILRADRATPQDARNPLEYELLKKFGAKEEAASIFKDATLKSACDPYRLKLEQAGLLPDSTTKSERWRRFGLAALFLGGVAFAKVAIGVSRERPVAFLVVLTVFALIAAAIAAFPRLTTRGRAMIADIKTFYAGLKDRGANIRRGDATAEMMMCAAVFGIAALTPTDYAFARTLFPQASSSSCGSSWGSSSSSCGSGGGCGGGCGGCGS